MSIKLVLDPASVDQTINYVEQTRELILQAIRVAMLDAMMGLSGTVADKLQGSPIVSRSGELLQEIIDSPHVTETAQLIRGTVSSNVGKKPLGLWLEEGTHVPAVDGKLFEFTPPGADTIYTRGHRAFDVKPHPFLNPSLHEYETTITELIQQAVDEAVGGDTAGALAA